MRRKKTTWGRQCDDSARRLAAICAPARAGRFRLPHPAPLAAGLPTKRRTHRRRSRPVGLSEMHYVTGQRDLVAIVHARDRAKELGSGCHMLPIVKSTATAPFLPLDVLQSIAENAESSRATVRAFPQLNGRTTDTQQRRLKRSTHSLRPFLAVHRKMQEAAAQAHKSRSSSFSTHAVIRPTNAADLLTKLLDPLEPKLGHQHIGNAHGMVADTPLDLGHSIDRLGTV